MSETDPETCDIPVPMTTVETVVTTHGEVEEDQDLDVSEHQTRVLSNNKAYF